VEICPVPSPFFLFSKNRIEVSSSSYLGKLLI
jgi:hypothetical protein